MSNFETIRHGDKNTDGTLSERGREQAREKAIELLESYRNKFKNLFLENMILALCDIKNGHLINTDKKEYDFRVGALEKFIGQNIS